MGPLARVEVCRADREKRFGRRTDPRPGWLAYDRHDETVPLERFESSLLRLENVEVADQHDGFRFAVIVVQASPFTVSD